MQGTEAMRDIRRWVGGRVVRTGMGEGEVGKWGAGESGLLGGQGRCREFSKQEGGVMAPKQQGQ